MAKAAALTASAGVRPLAAQESAADEGQQTFLRLLRSSNASVARMLESAQAAGRGSQRSGNSADLAAPRESVVRELLNGPPSRAGRGVGRGGNIAALVAAYCASQSPSYRSQKLIPLMESAERFRRRAAPRWHARRRKSGVAARYRFRGRGARRIVGHPAPYGRPRAGANQGYSEQVSPGCRRGARDGRRPHAQSPMGDLLGAGANPFTIS